MKLAGGDAARHDIPEDNDEVECKVITETVMEGSVTNPSSSSAINETLFGDQLNSSSALNATDSVTLPAYIAYTSFVLFRFAFHGFRFLTFLIFVVLFWLLG